MAYLRSPEARETAAAAGRTGTAGRNCVHLISVWQKVLLTNTGHINYSLNA